MVLSVCDYIESTLYIGEVEIEVDLLGGGVFFYIWIEKYGGFVDLVF